MDTVTRQSATLVEQAYATAQSLKDQSHVLNEAVSVFLPATKYRSLTYC